MKSARSIVLILFLLGFFIPLRSVHADILTQSTVVPSITPSFTITPSMTASITLTPTPSVTPIIVTVIHTKIVTRLAPTSTLTATATNTVTVEATSTRSDQTEDVPMAPYAVAIVGMIATFIAGLVVGTLLSGMTRKPKG